MSKTIPAYGMDQLAFESGRAYIDLHFHADSSGNPVLNRHLGVLSVGNPSPTGTYLVTLLNKWPALLGISATVTQAASYDATKAVGVLLLDEDVASAGTLALGIVKGDGTAVNLAVSDLVKVTITFQYNKV
jgi:hypothetical protein